MKPLKTIAVGALLTAVLSASALAASAGGATVNASGLNLRAETSTASASLAVAGRNSSVIILDKSNSAWYKVYYSGKTGYMHADYLKATETLDASFGTGTIKGTSVRLRSQPNTGGSVLGTYNAGAALTVTGVSGVWYKVSVDGKSGYVHSDYVTLGGSGSGSASETSTAGTVKGTYVRLRSGPGTGSSILGTYNTGASLTVTGTSGDWYKVTVSGKSGYIHKNYVTMGSSGSSGDTSAANTTGTIKGTYVRLRSGANTSSSILGVYHTGTKMTVTGTSGTWYKVSYNGTEGYVHSDYMVLSDGTASSGTGQAIVDTAMQYLGVSYVYGGASPSGFDCSGLVYYLYQLHGYSINRTASTQMNNGVSVNKSDLQSGDLVFFANGSGGSIGHVGIYIGNNKFIHASSGGGSVITSDLTSNYYATYYSAARRIV